MTKTQIWDNAQEIIKNNDLSIEVFNELEALLKPKSGGASTRPEDIDGKTYCRYTGEFWDYSDMVYQNKEAEANKKHKGYSKEGISRWTKARRDLVVTKDKLLAMMLSEKPDKDVLIELKDKLKNLEENSNDYEFLKAYKGA